MKLGITIEQYLRRHLLQKFGQTDPETAYDLWAKSYDQQTNNLILCPDQELFSRMMEKVSLRNQQVIDIGCGTGRLWHKLLAQHPAKLVGYDVSKEMLRILKHKFPAQQVYRQTDYQINQPDNKFGILLSTLTLSYIPDMPAALREWIRIMRPGGEILITDYHPAMLKKAGSPIFFYQGKRVSVKHHIHGIKNILHTAQSQGLSVVEVTEKRVEQSMYCWYEQKGALPVYEKFKGIPVVFSCHFRKSLS